MTDPTHTDLQAELREVDEALAAVAQAVSRVRQARDQLASARNWGTYDTWFGGGLFSSWVKHDRIVDAEGAMRQLDAALDTAHRELADVGVGPVGAVGVEPLSRTLDIWFDNIFSDWGTQNRIKDAQARLEAVAAALVRADGQLRVRRGELEHAIGAAGA